MDKQLKSLHELILCANLAFGIAVAVTYSAERLSMLHIAATGSSDHLRKALLAINGSVHLHPLDPFGTDVILTIVAAFLLIIFALLLKLDGAVRRSRFTFWFGGLAALMAVPLAWLFYDPSVGSYTWPTDPKGWLWVMLELGFVAAILYLTRTRPRPAWLLSLTGHYLFWGWLLWHTAWNPHFWPSSALPFASSYPIALSLIAPCAGLVWVLSFAPRLLQLQAANVERSAAQRTSLE